MARAPADEVTIVAGSGSWVTDDRGRRYLDASASLWYCNIGHGRDELADAAAAQMRRLAAEAAASCPRTSRKRRGAGT
jgi:adenosylmethionine-8-amino-7-oxononanoate aminotransferase